MPVPLKLKPLHVALASSVASVLIALSPVTVLAWSSPAIVALARGIRQKVTNGSVADQMQSQLQGNPFSGLAQGFGTMADGLVNSMIYTAGYRVGIAVIIMAAGTYAAIRVASSRGDFAGRVDAPTLEADTSAEVADASANRRALRTPVAVALASVIAIVGIGVTVALTTSSSDGSSYLNPDGTAKVEYKP